MSDARQRLVVITPVHNEGPNLRRVAEALLAQTRRPHAWVIVDDRSTDDTPRIAAEIAARVPFVEVLSAPYGDEPPGADRLAVAREARAFNWALRQVDEGDWTHVCKLDGDIELAPEHFATLLGRMAADPQLGIVGGSLVEPFGGRLRPVRIPDYHVHGALKLYSRDCFEAIGGMEERLGWDTIDETYARMRGFATRSYTDLVAVHLRPSASAGGKLRGRARHGQCAHICRYGAGWVTLRALKMATHGPVVLSGLAFLYGYWAARLTASPRVDDEAFKRFVRAELRGRMRRAVRLAPAAPH
jgi:poly-beta-1,6-N-acetyl-D-glucosamine synthase